MRFIEKQYSYDDVLLVPKYSDIESRSQVDTSTIFANTLKLKYPLVSANMDTVTGVKMANTLHRHGAHGILNRHQFSTPVEHEKAIKDLDIRSFCVGVKDKDKEFIDSIADDLDERPSIITIDVAHGHHASVRSMIAYIKTHATKSKIIAGNVATSDGALYLANMGVDGIKIGVGPGSLCTTRLVTGAGYPQLSAINQIDTALAHAAVRSKVTLIADGGIRYAGDIVKALAAGADTVMLGSLLAGTEETPGKVYWEPSGASYKTYRGQASLEAQEDQNKEKSEIYAEGVFKKVPYLNKSATEVVDNLMKGVRSGMSYCGARNIEELRYMATFVEVSPSTLAENKPHGLE